MLSITSQSGGSLKTKQNKTKQNKTKQNKTRLLTVLKLCVFTSEKISFLLC